MNILNVFYNKVHPVLDSSQITPENKRYNVTFQEQIHDEK